MSRCSIYIAPSENSNSSVTPGIKVLGTHTLAAASAIN
jgi:hypothetical protein